MRQVGFVFDEVSQQELTAFPHLTTPERVLRYIHIRNFIVRTWRRRSTQHLPLSVVKERLVKHFGETEIEQVYSYLHYAGFINFGVLKHPMVSQLSRRKARVSLQLSLLYIVVIPRRWLLSLVLGLRE